MENTEQRNLMTSTQFRQILFLSKPRCSVFSWYKFIDNYLASFRKGRYDEDSVLPLSMDTFVKVYTGIIPLDEYEDETVQAYLIAYAIEKLNEYKADHNNN